MDIVKMVREARDLANQAALRCIEVEKQVELLSMTVSRLESAEQSLKDLIRAQARDRQTLGQHLQRIGELERKCSNL